jgi:tetratricopeptide (TPR) repeat protein
LNEQPEDKDRIDRLEKEIRQALQRKEWAVALTMCEDLLECHPHHGNFLLMAGQAHEGLGEMKEARQFFERVQKITHSLMPCPLELIARIEAKQGNLKKAIAYMQLALAVSYPLFANPRLLFTATLLMQAGRYKEAAKSAKKVTLDDKILYCQAQELLAMINDAI